MASETRTRETSAEERRRDRALAASTQVAAGAVWLLLIAIVGAIIYYALPAMEQLGLEFITSTTWNPASGREQYGILPMIYGTFISSLIALLVAVPLGLGSAIFLSEDFLPTGIRSVLIFMVELLAAIPSVVYGLWGIFVVIPSMEPLGDWLHANFGWLPFFSSPSIGPGVLPASIVLAIMIFPITTSLSQSSLLALPPELRSASLGLGATRWTTIFRVLIPAAFSGIAGGVLLALGRALGETMAVTMLIGNSNQLSPSLLAPGNTIASLLANQFAEARGLQVNALVYAGLVLLVMTFVVNALGFRIIESVRSKNQ